MFEAGTISKRISVLALFAVAPFVAAASPAPAVPDGEVKVKYRISFAGFDLARANLATKIERGLYATRVGYRTTGIVRVFATAVGDIAANGAIDGSRIIPAGFTQASTENKKDAKVAMTLAGGSVKTSEAIPPQGEDPDRILVKDEHKRNVLDPLSALMIPYTRGKDGLTSACSRSLPIFDGWTRFDITLSLKSVQDVDRAGYKGPTVTCAVRWVPIAGHIPDRKGTKFMAENKDIEVTLAPIGDTGLLAPLHIGLQTMRGHVDVDALEFIATKSTSRLGN